MTLRTNPPPGRCSGAKPHWRWRQLGLLPALEALVLGAFLVTACARRPPASIQAPPAPKIEIETVTQAGFAIQVGAFRDLGNAVRLAKSLNHYGLDAYYFKHDSGLFKVRFGDFASRESAQRQAEAVHLRGLIEDFFIVSPDSYVSRAAAENGAAVLRSAIVVRAESFVGIPYQWGGTSPENGFDCSGLVLAVYNLVGLNMPRTSAAQFAGGKPIDRDVLAPGDLVFFRTSNSARINHVGIYTGDDRFIHAPGEDKMIREDSLSSPYFNRRFAGACSYLQ